MWRWWWAVWWCKGQSYICLRNLQAEFPASLSLWVLRERKGGSSEENKCFLNFEFLCFDILPDFFLSCDQSSFINFALSQWHFVSRKWLSCHIWGLERAKGWKSLFYLSSYSVTAESPCRHAFPLAYACTTCWPLPAAHTVGAIDRKSLYV